jgi:hypothetical protein
MEGNGYAGPSEIIEWVDMVSRGASTGRVDANELLDE